jgi:hypothetical protein
VYQHTVTGNFDAVMALDAVMVNDLWRQRYLHAEEHGGIAYNLTTDWEFIFTFDDLIFESRISGNLSSPLVSFIEGIPNEIKLAMKLNDAVYESRARSETTGKVEYDDPIFYEDPISIDSYNNLAKIHGHIDSQDMVVVNFEDTRVFLKIDGLKDEPSAMETAIKNYFVENLHSRNYNLGTVDFDSAVTPKSLQPRNFVFTTGGFKSSSRGYGTLYLCIYTRSSTPSSDDVQVCDLSVLHKDRDPGIPSGYTAALYVSSKVIFDNILIDVTKKLGPGIAITTIPGVDRWPASQLIGKTPVTLELPYTIKPTCTGPKSEIAILTIPTSEFLMGPTQIGSLGFSWQQTWESSIIYYNDAYDESVCTAHREIGSMEFTLSIHTSTNLTVDSNGLVSFPKFQLELGSVSHGSGSMDEEKAADGVVNALREYLENILPESSSKSVFALTDLIFPEVKVIDTTRALLPGDLLVLGNVTEDYNPNPSGH